MAMKFFSAIAFLYLLSSCSEPDDHNFKAVDGDSIFTLDEKNDPIKYDLAFIDAPEREQPFGNDAKKYLNKLLLNDNLKVSFLADNTVELYLNDKSINLDMVSKGYAWASLKISDNKIKTLYINAQMSATENLQGIWSLGHGLMIAPWQWRTQGKEKMTNGSYQKQQMYKRQKQKKAQLKTMKERQLQYTKQKALAKEKAMAKKRMVKDEKISVT